METCKKYIIGRGIKSRSTLNAFLPNVFINKNKEHVLFDLEIEAKLFESKEEADEFIVNELPNQRIRKLLNENSEYYEAVQVICVKDVYYFDKTLAYKPEDLNMIYEEDDKIITESHSKVYTVGKIHSYQKKQPEGYLGYYYVL